MKRDPTLEQIAELMSELEAYHNRIVVVKIGGNSIAEDEHFLAKIARQVKFLNANGVRVVIVHGGGPQIDDALRAAKIKSVKGPDGRRITSPKAMQVVHKTMNGINLEVVAALVDAGCAKEKIVCAARHPRFFVQAKPLDRKDKGTRNRSGLPKSVAHQELIKLLEQGEIVALHSVGIGADGKTVFNINGDDYAMAVAIAIKAKRLILVTNISGVLDRGRKRIPALDQDMAATLMKTGVITGGMVPKVESALWVVKQGVGGVAIIDGFAPWAILAEMLTHEGFGTLVQTRLGG
jgi:acetylglutamate kinase